MFQRVVPSSPSSQTKFSPSALMIEAGRFSAHIHRLYVLEDGSVCNHCQENRKSLLTSDRYLVRRPFRTPRSKCIICCQPFVCDLSVSECIAVCSCCSNGLSARPSHGVNINFMPLIGSIQRSFCDCHCSALYTKRQVRPPPLRLWTTKSVYSLTERCSSINGCAYFYSYPVGIGQ